ncbi:MAG TPA: 3-dehydroquinate synthase [Bacillus bacterium]|uniref:3-dehydroquinate synthase n=1 Tax=Siminovitchia fordii TaxID=254759 RepID=A0ABQ4K5Q3_9BACI|nr:3-dehydroquinate synthase [Siminovitchia fordii]GIN21057.1 3-dehydroquinate synthase [Siminovitchia fordii]HBZ09436.1 3-dehydroquinate synthase [Bacillus sp. (in: firmicutes)]
MEITVQTASKSYPIFIKSNALDELATVIQKNKFTNLLIITDETVGRLHLDTLRSALKDTVDYSVFTVPSGEEAKQMSVFESCLTFALEQGLDRKSCFIAFGGGAVGDLAGFVAATYMRGISFIQVPTTILAHDSAVGGKTAINHPLGKNMIGAFHQPEAVIYHTEFIKTLPDHEVRSGFTEAVKHALIADPVLLSMLMDNIIDLHEMTDEQLIHVLQRGMEIKANIVSIDEKESGLRAVLNLGHTLGHVIESHLGYGKTTHGEAVMIGIIYALHVSKEMLGLSFPVDRFEEWVKRLGYKIELPQDLTFEKVYEGMQRDKKTIAKCPRFILLEAPGKPVLKEVEENLLEKVYEVMIEQS